MRESRSACFRVSEVSSRPNSQAKTPCTVVIAGKRARVELSKKLVAVCYRQT